LPLLFLDVSISGQKVARLVINEGDNPMKIIEQFSKEYKLDPVRKEKLKKVVEKHMGLTSIQERKSE